jgi:hypothetical protein
MRNNIPRWEQPDLRAVLMYERNATVRDTTLKGNSLTVRERIGHVIALQPPLVAEEIVWRGQASNTIASTSWMSTSRHGHIALMYGGKYLFKIHLEPGVRCLDMYAYYQGYGIENPAAEANAVRAFLGLPDLNMSHDYVHFGEVIVQAGGTFWKDAAHKKPGFRRIGTARSRVPPDTLPPPTEGQTTLVLTEKDYPLVPVFETWYSVGGGR